MILDKIVENKIEEVNFRKKIKPISELKKLIAQTKPLRKFSSSITKNPP